MAFQMSHPSTPGKVQFKQILKRNMEVMDSIKLVILQLNTLMSSNDVQKRNSASFRGKYVKEYINSNTELLVSNLTFLKLNG